MAETIFALSSGLPPAAIAVVRVSGPRAGAALATLAGALPDARVASLRALRDPQGALLDRALVLWFPGPATATGEDLAELHLHGGRAVIAAVEAALARQPGLRRAEPGEFTRRAFVNGRIDLAQAEGLADLLAAETELQRRAALAMASGALTCAVDGWRARLLAASAAVEAELDFANEDDVAATESQDHGLVALAGELREWLALPSAEALRDGFRVVLAGPPNAGKSTLFNALVGSEAAIATPIAGTTRDVLVRSIALEGVPFSVVDTAGLHEAAADPIEAIGISRAKDALVTADLVLWLGDPAQCPTGAWPIEPQVDRGSDPARTARHRVSALTGEGLRELGTALVDAARSVLPGPGEAALNRRQRGLLAAAEAAIAAAARERDPLIRAEQLRTARAAFDALLGRTAIEELLDTLFARFCIGK